MPKLPELSAPEKTLREQAGRRLEHQRRAMGLTREQAAGLAGVSRFAWRRMEMGKARIDLAPLLRLAAAYPVEPGLPVTYVLTGSMEGYPQRLRVNLEHLARVDPVGTAPLAESTAHQPPVEIARKRRSPGTPSAHKPSGKVRKLADLEAVAPLDLH